MESPILVTGIPRSGSSMIAAALVACGAFGGRMSKRGMYCNDKIRNTIVKPYFSRIGVDKEGHNFELPIGYNVPKHWGEWVEAVIKEQGYIEGPWLYKDSRTILIWPVWNYIYPNAKWIIVRRKTPDIIKSCVQTAHMKTFKDEEQQKQVGVQNEEQGWLWMVHKYEEEFRSLIQTKIKYKEIWPERMANGDFKQMHEVCEWAGLTWNDKALDFITPLLWGSKSKERRTI
jgi:hypothetical protein